MEEPNLQVSLLLCFLSRSILYPQIKQHVAFLQSVEHEVEFILDKSGKEDRYKINARDFFVPTQVNFLVSKSFVS